MMFLSGVQVNTSDMWLVYEDSEGVIHEQPWQDVESVGTLDRPGDWRRSPRAGLDNPHTLTPR